MGGPLARQHLVASGSVSLTAETQGNESDEGREIKILH